jgi:hypothetical protein
MNLISLLKHFWYEHFVSLPKQDIKLISKSPLHGVITDRDLEAIARRNDLASKRKIKELGKRWICHRDNWVQRKTVRQGVLNARAT